MITSANFQGVERSTVTTEMSTIVNFFSIRSNLSEYGILKQSLFEVKMFMRIKALKGNAQKQYLNFSSKENKNWDMHLFDNKTMDLIISCQLGATVNSYETVACKETYILIYKF